MTDIAAVYNGGTYGTYLAWLMTLTNGYDDDSPIELPFNSNGNSHKFHWKTSNILTHCHPKHQDECNQENVISNNIDDILVDHRYGVYIYPGKNTQLLSLNNFFSKIWSFDDLCDNLLLDVSMFYTNWDVSTDTTYSEIPQWILREFFSINMMTSWRSQIEWNHVETYASSKLHRVLVDDMVGDIHTTLYNICDFCDIEHKLPYDKLEYIHNEMLKLQVHIGKDRLCRTIVAETLNGRYYDYSDKQLSLVDESWIQWELRNKGYEMYCDGLNEFPSNTEELDKKIYKK